MNFIGTKGDCVGENNSTSVIIIHILSSIKHAILFFLPLFSIFFVLGHGFGPKSGVNANWATHGTVGHHVCPTSQIKK